MKRVAILLMLFLLLPAISAEIIILENPLGTYNLGDIISVPVKITSLSEAGDMFLINLICNSAQAELHRQYITIPAGGETEINQPIPLIRSFIGNLTGNCRMRYSFGSEIQLTTEFTVSEQINIDITSLEKDFAHRRK